MMNSKRDMPDKARYYHSANHGFTAVEVLIAIIFAGVMLLSISLVYTTINKLNGGSRDLLLANETAKAQLDIYRGMEFSAMPSGGTETKPIEVDFTAKLPASLPGPKSGTVEIADWTNTVKSVRAVVKFQGSTGERTVVQTARINDAAVEEGQRVQSVTAATTHSCALYNSIPYCWGSNYDYKSGNTTVAVSTPFPTPVDRTGVLGGVRVTAIEAGGFHSCVIGDGKPYCWGYANAGRLGNGITAEGVMIGEPVAVDTSTALAGKTVTDISAGRYHTCAVADGTAVCWGSSWDGQSGTGTFIQVVDDGVAYPTNVINTGVLSGKTVTDIEAAEHHTCAIADGKAYCWGLNNEGQLGDGTTNDVAAPVAVDASGVLAGKTVTDISGHTWHTCAVADGKAYCWGYNGDGQLGNGTTTNSHVPVAVDSTGVLAGKTVTDISTGKYHTCAIADGKAYCWGYNGYGRLGDDYTADPNSTVPVAVYDQGALKGKVLDSISVGEEHACAAAGVETFCWGRSGSYRTGTGTLNGLYEPAAVIKDW